MSSTEILERGDVQVTSAGAGIFYCEKGHGGDEVHFLRIWSLPATERLQPKYFTRHFTDEEKADKWAKVIAPVWTDGVKDMREGERPAPVQSASTLRVDPRDRQGAQPAFGGKKGLCACYPDKWYNDRRRQRQV